MVPLKSRLFLFSLLSLPAHIKVNNIRNVMCVCIIHTLVLYFFTLHGFNISLGDVVISLCWPLLIDGAVAETKQNKKVLIFVL